MIVLHLEIEVSKEGARTQHKLNVVDTERDHSASIVNENLHLGLDVCVPKSTMNKSPRTYNFYMVLPRYPSVNPTVLKCILWRMIGRSRSFKADAQRLCAQVRPGIHYKGLENIDLPRPFVITANHFARPGFSTAWIALSLSAALPGEVTWIMSNQWLFKGNPLAFIVRPLMRFVLKGINNAYSFVPMPTMIGGYSTPQERTSGVREAIRRMRENPRCILGITPEGMDSPTGGLALPPAGVGRFLLHLQQMGVTMLPASVYEQQGILYVRFGESYQLEPPSGLPPAEVDMVIRKAVMGKIAELIP